MVRNIWFPLVLLVVALGVLTIQLQPSRSETRSDRFLMQCLRFTARNEHPDNSPAYQFTSENGMGELKEALTQAGRVVTEVHSTEWENGVPEADSLPMAFQDSETRDWLILAGWSELDKQVAVINQLSQVEWRDWSDLAPRIDRGLLLSFKNSNGRAEEPQLYIPGDGVNLGQIDAEHPNNRQVTLFNIGGRPLRIRDQHFSCGCTQGKLEAKIIPPGGWTRMQTSIDVSKMNVRNVNLNWFVATEHDTEAKTVPVTARAELGARFNPDYFVLGNIAPKDASQELQTTLELPETEGAATDFEPIHLDSGFKLIRMEKHSGGFNLTWRLDAWEAKRDASGFFRTEGLFAFHGSSGRRTVSMGAVGRLEPWIKVFPAIVNVGEVFPGQTIERKVQFKSHAQGQAMVSVVHPEYVEASVELNSLSLKIKAPSTPKVFRTGVLLRVGGESVAIPVTGVLTDRSIAQSELAP